MLKALQGRIGRKSYWVGTVFVLFLVIVLLVIAVPSDVKRVLHVNLTDLPDDAGFGGVAAAGLWLLAMVNTKRLHDRDRTAWWLAAPAVLLVSTVALLWGAPGPALAFYAPALIALPITLWLIAEAGFLAGTAGPNRFGPNPMTAEPEPVKIDREAVTRTSIQGFSWSPFAWPVLLLLRLTALPFILIRKRDVLFGFTGRLGRRDFWALSLFAFAGALIIDVLAVNVGMLLSGRHHVDVDANSRMTLVHLAALGLASWAFAAISGKRMHDRNHSAWWVMALSPLLLVILLPPLGPSPALETGVGMLLLLSCPLALWLIVQLGVLKGTLGPNRFGPDPNVL